eukprot:g4727.t1
MNAKSGRELAQNEQQQHVRDLTSEKFTPQMWMDCLERIRAAHNAGESSRAHLLQQPHCLAAARGRADVVRFLVGKGYCPDVSCPFGHTPLRLAAMGGHLAVVRALLDAGADVSLRCARYFSALECALSGGHLDVASVLIDYGADVNAPIVNGITSLHRAALGDEAEHASLLLANGADVDALDDLDRTPLRFAVMGNHVAVARVLLDAGADASVRCAEYSSSLDLAIILGHVDVATLLIEHGADVDADPIDCCNTPLHHAATHGEAGTASLLLTKGAAVNAVEEYGSTPLSLAAGEGHAATTQVLLAAGADVTIRRFDNGMSALDRAAKRGHVGVLRSMIEHGVDVNAADGTGVTATHIAAMCDKAEAINVLAEAGAKMDLKTEEHGFTPLHFAAFTNYPAAVLALSKHDAPVSARDAVERAPLHYAAAKAGVLGAAEVVDLLLRLGADENAIDRDGQTPADMVGSSMGGEDSVAEEVERVRQLLLNAPADRAWRRRGFLVLCRAHYPSGKVQLQQAGSHAHDAGMSKRTRSRPGLSRAEREWAGVASMLMGAGSDSISLMGDGADVIFQTVVGYL